MAYDTNQLLVARQIRDRIHEADQERLARAARQAQRTLEPTLRSPRPTISLRLLRRLVGVAGA